MVKLQPLVDNYLHLISRAGRGYDRHVDEQQAVEAVEHASLADLKDLDTDQVVYRQVDFLLRELPGPLDPTAAGSSNSGRLRSSTSPRTGRSGRSCTRRSRTRCMAPSRRSISASKR